MNLKRIIKLSMKYSLFLFGARGTGKSTLLMELFPPTENLYINLLDPLEEERFARNPNELIYLAQAMPAQFSHIIIDEIQKVPKLLDTVHLLIETHKLDKLFIMTGSSARKLKMAGVNLLAGRAFIYHLYPFSFVELDALFNLQQALSWGLLPKVFSFDSNEEKLRFLQSYAITYLKEEIWAEQLVRNLDPFRKFLEVAAQSNAKIINYSNIARDVGADDKTVKNYFSILEDTLLGFVLEPFQHSFRKRLKLSPKFYFFDIGVARALAKTLSVIPTPGTSYYGELFEQFIVVECMKLASYFQSEYKFSYLMTAAGLELDLVVERPGQKILFIEIKSKSNVDEHDLSTMALLIKDFGDCEAICLSQDVRQKRIGSITVFPWQEGIKLFFGLNQAGSN